MNRLIILAGIAAALTLAPAAGRAQEFTLTIKNHQFSPAEIKVPANTRVKLTVVNDDATPEEFESHEMKVEKIIPGKSKAVLRIGPLKPGRYPFVGEFHEATAKGTVIAE
jgi:plastocyanin